MKLSLEHREYLEFMVDLWQYMDHVSGKAKGLYCLLLTYENRKTNTCYPCQADIARHLKITPESLPSLMEELEKADLLRRTKRYKGKRFNYVYKLYAPQPKGKLRNSSAKSRVGKIVHFPALISTNSIRSTTQEGGNSAST
jgi:hypothetical protein